MATNDRSAEEAEEALRQDIASAIPDSVPAEEAKEATVAIPYEIFNSTAKDAIEYFRQCEDVSEIYDLIQAEEKGKGRKTIIAEGMSRVQELNILKETEREQAQQVDLATPEVSNSDTNTPEAVAPPPVLDEVEEYPIEDGAWEGEMGRYIEFKHISRTMHPMGGVGDRVVSPRRLNEYLEEHFAQGYELIEVLPQGFGPDGVSLLYVMGRVRDDLKPKFTSIWHVQRTLTERPMQTGGITGFQADKYLNSFLSEGWQLIAAKSLKDGEAEIPMLWVLVR